MRSEIKYSCWHSRSKGKNNCELMSGKRYFRRIERLIMNPSLVNLRVEIDGSATTSNHENLWNIKSCVKFRKLITEILSGFRGALSIFLK